MELSPAEFAGWLATAEAPLRRSLASFASVTDTEAVLQEALLRVWQRAPGLEHDGRGDPLLRFGLRCARNLAISEARRAGFRGPMPEGPAHEPSTNPPPPDPMLRRHILACCDELPPKPQAAFMARLLTVGGQGDASLAVGLGMTRNTFLKNFGRARSLLADCLRAAGVEVPS